MPPDTAPELPPEVIGGSDAESQLASAFVTALSHHDAATRERAETRLRGWDRVLTGVARGWLRVGSRRPVVELPSWVTLDVLRGGWATGTPAAGGPLQPCELAFVEQADLRPERRELFGHLLTEQGLAELWTLLDSGRYAAIVPEETALLTVAWLVRVGDRLGALALLDELMPFADRLRLAPRPSAEPLSEPDIVSRATVGEVGADLRARRHNERVETMRETLLVWNPFADELLELWLATVVDGRVGATADDAWFGRAAALLDRYRRLAEEHRLSRKHRSAKENVGILLSETERALDSRRVEVGGRPQYAVTCMLERRGEPGSPGHGALRARQARDASLPTRHALAQVLVARLAALPQLSGLRSSQDVMSPVTTAEATGARVPVGSAFPPELRRVVDRALAARIDELVERGVVPSAEVLAELVPAIAAATTAASYPDPSLQRLVATTYRAFRRRRSLLLTNLEHQVQLTELPWMRALEPHRSRDAASRSGAEGVLLRLTDLTMTGFPATFVPNRLVRELTALAREAGWDLPFVEELAADIFMGEFSPKFVRAAKVAATLLQGSLYEHYYDVPYDFVRRMVVPGSRGTERHRGAAPGQQIAFARLCFDRAGVEAGGYSIAANGMVVEQAQILTTHNLATLVVEIGLDLRGRARGLLDQCWRTVVRRMEEAHSSPRPLAAIKDAAYAWRQMLFFLSLHGVDAPAAVDAIGADLRQRSALLQHRLAPVVGGLEDVMRGDRFDADGRTARGRRFTAWTVEPHWALQSGHDLAD